MSKPQRNYRGKAMRMIDPEVFRPANMAAELKRLEMVPAPRELGYCDDCRKRFGSGALFGADPEQVKHLPPEERLDEGVRLCVVCFCKRIERNHLKGGLD